MPLSDHEQRVLDQLELDFAADNCAPDHPISPKTQRHRPPQRLLLESGFLFVVGLSSVIAALLIKHLVASVWLVLLGFSLMLASSVWASNDLRRRRAHSGSEHRPRPRRFREPKRRRSASAWAQRRWMQRRD